MDSIIIEIDKDRLEKVLQYVEKIIDKEERDKENMQKGLEGLSAAYENNYKMYKEQLAIWENLPLAKKLVAKKPVYS